MKSARHQLILLGLICQGLSWEDYFLPLGYTLGWLLCLRLQRMRFQYHEYWEAVLLVLGCVMGYFLGAVFGKSVHFFLGHGLALVQLVRLLKCPSRRDQIFSLMIALFHLAVGCTFLFDLRFVPILLAALMLLPKTLCELEQASFPGSPGAASQPSNHGLPWRAYTIIFCCMVLFYLLFPRALVGSGLAVRSGVAGGSGVLDSILDPSLRAQGRSSQVLFQIEGSDLGYLRCMSLTVLDGCRWLPAQKRAWRRIDYVEPEKLGPYKHRRVRVKNAQLLGRNIPTDGQPVNLGGNFFSSPYHNIHGGVFCNAIWNRDKNIYEYWSGPLASHMPFYPALTAAYTNHPPQSARLRQWLDSLLKDSAGPLAKARKLEAFLRDNFTYTAGAPELNRIQPTDDFIFNQKQGHCERFAAALGLFLRMEGIPSRVVIGFVPSARNMFSEAFSIRVKDIHAWTEAYIAGAGWLQLDATPRAVASPNQVNLGDYWEELDFFWASYVVNFDMAAQSALLRTTVLSFGQSALWVGRHFPILAGFLVIAGLIWLARKKVRRTGARSDSRHSQARVRIAASHTYARMLQILEKKGCFRDSWQTPLEFMSQAQNRFVPLQSQVQLITHYFCATRYGEHPASLPELECVEQALEQIKKHRE